MTSTVFGEMGFLGMLTTVSALQGFALAVFLLVRHRGETHAVRWLVLMIVLMSMHLADMTFAKTALLAYFVPLADTTFSLLFLIGPLYYFYVRALLNPARRLQWLDILHTLPALYILLGMLDWIFIDPAIKQTYIEGRNIAPPTSLPLDAFLKLGFNIVQNFAYLWASLRLGNLARTRLEEQSADTAVTADIDRLQNVTRAFTVWVAGYLVFFTVLANWGEYGEEIDHFWLFINGLFILVLGISSVARPARFDATLRDSQGALQEDREAEAKKYEKSTLNDVGLKALKVAFELLMEKEKLYLESTLRMPDVAQKLSASPHHLSQMLNQEIGIPFLAVINRYRTAEVIRLMQEEGRSDTVLTLAFSAGFNNKNSFNRAFRQETGKTPSTYRKALQT
ncbi:MAG: hypothetical protein COB37_10430 [Kordiimonadales bacterium]|nr:MAG: hypothetical protein COB37_10430 [Kordiimonadales bacterium]